MQAAGKSNIQISITLRSDLLKKWKSLCSHSGITAQEGVRQLISAYLSKLEENRNPHPTKFRRQPGEKRSVPVQVSFSPSEDQLVEAAAVEHGASKTSFIRNCVRSSISGERLATARDVEALEISNHLLLKLGNNVNQLARYLNKIRPIDANNKHVIMVPENLKELSKTCLDHVQNVRQFLWGRS